MYLPASVNKEIDYFGFKYKKTADEDFHQQFSIYAGYFRIFYVLKCQMAGKGDKSRSGL
jgi:hypothetical protein